MERDEKETDREREKERQRRSEPQAPFGPPMGWLCHPCITTLTSPISFLSLKLSPPPCAALCYEEWNLGNELQVAWVFITWVSGLSSAHSESDLP